MDHEGKRVSTLDEFKKSVSRKDAEKLNDDARKRKGQGSK